MEERGGEKHRKGEGLGVLKVACSGAPPIGLREMQKHSNKKTCQKVWII